MNPYTSSGSVATMTANVSGNDKLNDLGDGPRQPGDPERYPVGAVTRRLMGYVRPHRVSFAASFVSAAISVILQLYTPILIGEGIDLIVAASQVDFDALLPLVTKLALVVVTRELTICKVNDHMDIAAFIMLGDAELTVAAAAELLKKCPEFDILLTAEAKGIPLAHEMSRQSGKPYVCARKGVKLYMPDPVVVEDQSITTAGKQKLVIDRKELDKMSGKRVLVVDDVISTGGSLKALDELAEQTQCTIVGQAAVLAEGDAAQRKDIIFLEPLPLFLH